MSATLFIVSTLLANPGPLGAAVPPVLTDPGGAVTSLDHVESPLARAEILLLAGRPDAARAAVRKLSGVEADAPRALRLELDALLDLGERTVGLARADALERDPRWAQHARWRRAQIDRVAARGSRVRLGMGLFALCLAVLVLGGGRELLRPRPEAILMAGAFLAAWAIIRLGAPALTSVVGLLGAGLVVLTQGAAATFRRTDPGARGRLFLKTLLFLGAIGLHLAVANRVQFPFLWALAGA